MKNIEVLEVFADHKLIKSEEKCLDCNGSLFRQYADGTIVCVKCLTPVLNPESDKDSK